LAPWLEHGGQPPGDASLSAQTVPIVVIILIIGRNAVVSTPYRRVGGLVMGHAAIRAPG
jgi:hypothetical protein